MDDVKNQALIDTPRGRVYRTEAHADLLHHDRGCRKPPPQKGTTKKRNRRGT